MAFSTNPRYDETGKATSLFQANASLLSLCAQSGNPVLGL